MKKAIIVVLAVVFMALPLAAQETKMFPPGIEYAELSADWSEPQTVKEPNYSTGWLTVKGNLELKWFMDTGEPVDGKKQLDRLLSGYGNGASEVEWSSFTTWSGYLEEYMDNIFVTYSYKGRHYMTWAGFRFDYYPTMVMISVPEADWSSNWVEMIDLIREF